MSDPDSRTRALDNLLLRQQEEKEEDGKDFFFARGKNENGRQSGDLPDMQVDAVQHGVTIGWLAQAFNMNHGAAKLRLKDCPPLYRRKGGFIYSLPLAARYLVPPIVDIEAYFKKMRIEDLPVRLQSEFYRAKKLRADYELEAGNLWRTEDVIEAYAEIFLATKAAVREWPEKFGEKQPMSEDMRDFLVAEGDRLLDLIYSTMEARSSMKVTPSLLMIEQQEEAAEEAAKFVQDFDEEPAEEGTGEEVDFDFSHLI